MTLKRLKVRTSQRTNQCPSVQRLHVTRVHSHIWLDALLRSGDGELVERKKKFIRGFTKERGRGRATRRGKYRKGLNEQAQKAAIPITGPSAASYQHSF